MTYGFIPLIVASSLLGLSPLMGTLSQSGCQQYPCFHFTIHSNSSITGITIALVPKPEPCISRPYCNPSGPRCNLTSNFCSTINTRSSTDEFTFQGVPPGYYWLELNANVGSNATTGIGTSIHVFSLTSYQVTANMTKGLATANFIITNATL